MKFGARTLLALAFASGIAGFFLMGRRAVSGSPRRYPALAGIILAAIASLVRYLLYYRPPYLIAGRVPLAPTLPTIALVNLTAARTI